MQFEYGLQYEALLQVIEGDEYLCNGVNDTEGWSPGLVVGPKKRDAGRHPGGGVHNMFDGGIEGIEEIRVLEEGKVMNGTDKVHVVPSNGVPVALLAKRGRCTYETKAQVASQQTSPHGTVRFLIVYNDDPTGGMITMMPKSSDTGAKGHDLYSDLGMVFVSYESGLDLKDYLEVQPTYVTQNGGPRILIDGEDHWFPSGSEPAAGLAMLLMLFGCICSLSLFLSTTAIGNREDNVFLLDGRREPRTGNGRRRRRRGNGLRCLTLEEVETLPTREYSGSEEEEDSPPNSSLELRDKSEMPYEDEDEGQGNGGGLCASLLPCKPETYGHNSCSICLDEYEVGEHIRVLPCQHAFHSECIFPWLTERSPTCPLCKAMFEAVKCDEEGQEEDPDEQAGGNRAASAAMPPPLEEEPEVHRRRSRRRRSNNTNSSRERTSSPTEGQTPGLRSRLFGLFGSASRQTNASLEEPLLQSDEAEIA